MKKIRFIITIALLTVASYGYAELDNSPFNNQVATQNSLTENPFSNSAPIDLSGLDLGDGPMKAPPGGGGPGTGNLGDEPIPLDENKLAIIILFFMGCCYSYILYKTHKKINSNN